MADKKALKIDDSKLTIYQLLPIIGAGIPLLFLIFCFSPILTNESSQIIAYTQYLATVNLHYYAEGWNSSVSILPFSIKYLMTFLYSDGASWASVLQYASIISYMIMVFTEFLLLLILRPRKKVTYVLCACISTALGLYSVLTSYTCNSFMLFVSIALLSLAILIFGIHNKFKLPVKIIISCLCVIPVLSLFLLSEKSSNRLSASESLKAELAASLVSPLGPNVTPESSDDCEATLHGLLAYLECNSIPILSADANTSNIISVCSKNSINIPTVPDLSSPNVSIEDDCRFISTTDITDNNSEFIYIIPNHKLSDYEKYRFLAKVKYTDNYYTIFYFSKPELLSDKNVMSDLEKLYSETYDTVLLSMYDISNYDLSYFSTYMEWTSVSATKRFDDLHLLDDYNSIIFSEKNNVSQYIFCIDPYILYKETGYDATQYKTLLQEKIINPICRKNKTVFYFYLPSYSITHFESYSTSDFVNLRNSYYMFADAVENLSNIKLYYSGSEEYIYSNTYMYEDGSDCLMLYETANTMLLDNLSDNAIKTPSEVRSCIDNLISSIQSLRVAPMPSYDFSDYCIVICGDSIFANTIDSTSIQNIIKNHSGTNYIFRAIGGSTASTIDGDTSTLKYQLDINTINHDLVVTDQNGKNLLFILEFGLNDYFQSMAISNPADKYDDSTYSGILRSSIEQIQSEWPNSKILIVVPGYITMWDNGTKINESNLILDNYRTTVQALSNEYGIYCFNQCEMGFTQDEADYYLLDNVHYNGRGRYLFAWELMSYLNSEVFQ